jgi:ABC-type polar amino acid transport system ATPase subunit
VHRKLRIGAPGGPAKQRCSRSNLEHPEISALRWLSSVRDFSIQRGECFGLLGPNGSGKTTTVEIIEGLLPPTAGEVELLGLRWGTDDSKLRERMGVALQETHLLGIGAAARGSLAAPTDSCSHRPGSAPADETLAKDEGDKLDIGAYELKE